MPAFLSATVASMTVGEMILGGVVSTIASSALGSIMGGGQKGGGQQQQSALAPPKAVEQPDPQAVQRAEERRLAGRAGSRAASTTYSDETALLGD